MPGRFKATLKTGEMSPCFHMVVKMGSWMRSLSRVSALGSVPAKTAVRLGYARPMTPLPSLSVNATKCSLSLRLPRFAVAVEGHKIDDCDLLLDRYASEGHVFGADDTIDIQVTSIREIEVFILDLGEGRGGIVGRTEVACRLRYSGAVGVVDACVTSADKPLCL